MNQQPQQNSNRPSAMLGASIVLAIGLIVGGYLTGDGLLRAKMADRAVTVRGLAERNVSADLATWTLAYSAQGSELASVQAESERATHTIKTFFKGLGFGDDALVTAGVNVNQWFDNSRGVNTVTVRQRMQLRTHDIARAKEAFAKQFELVRLGITLEDASGMIYSFTKLNEVKPQMIAEATRDARRGAEQFAKDSGSAVGGIRQATQGYFSVSARDGDQDGSGSSSPDQKVRVVTTVEFYLR